MGFSVWFYRKNQRYTVGFLWVFRSIQAVFDHYADESALARGEWFAKVYDHSVAPLMSLGCRSLLSSDLHMMSMIWSGCMSLMTLALFSHLTRIPTLSRLSHSFLCCEVVSQNVFFACCTGRPFCFSRNSIRWSSGTLSNLMSSSCEIFQSSTMTSGFLSHIRIKAFAISSRWMVAEKMRNNLGMAYSFRVTKLNGSVSSKMYCSADIRKKIL